ncbi:MAG: right-handed parallel beta-helix repeat-containing protein [bacterium]
MRKAVGLSVVLGLVLVVMLVVLTAHVAKAETIRVPDDYITIQAAIDAAGEGDVIMVEMGTYYENIHFSGISITVKSRDPNDRDIVSATVIDGHQAGSVVTFSSEEEASSVLSGFTVRNGAAVAGGGIYCENSSPRITNCTISGNSTSYGGAGIFCEKSSPSIENCVVYGNSGGWGGSGIFCSDSSSPTITNCTISGNDGGISCCRSSSPYILNSIFWGNVSPPYYHTSPIEATSLSNPRLSYCDIEGGYPGTGNINADPLFVNPADGDYRLKIGSLCIDAGHPRMYDTDHSRSDIGAHGGGGGSDSPITITVATDGSGDFNSLQEAFDNTVTGDTLTVLPGIYSENLVIGNKEVSIISANGAESTIIDGSGSGSVIVLTNPGSGCILDGFTIRNGSADYGGGIFCSSSSLSITNCIITGNSANGINGSGGGGIFCRSSSPTIANCTITGNSDTKGGGGGGIFCQTSSPTIANCTISGNSALSGAGIFCEGNSSPAIENSIISKNSGIDTYEDCHGGGIFCRSSSPTIANCTISENVTNDGGAGIFCEGNSSPVIENSIISKNLDTGVDFFSSDGGGGIFCTGDSSPRITNCTINENSASARGGGIFCTEDSSPNIKDCTINSNSADVGGGIYCLGGSLPTIEHCTISENSATGYGGGGIYGESSSPTITNCIISKNSALSGNGGGIFCKDSSPSITDCTISENAASVNSALRSSGGGGIYCMGDSCPRIIGSTISQNSANGSQCYGGGIACDEDSSPTIENCFIKENLVATASTYSAFGGGIYCSLSSSPDISHCTIIGNSTNSGSGGGIFCLSSSSVTIKDCTISSNSALDGYGGGIFCSSSSPAISNCSISQNSVNGDYGSGGGIACSDSSPAISNCIISQNSASGSTGAALHGGGISCIGSSPAITDCTITENLASGDGGGIHCYHFSSPTITDSSISGNSASRHGGGIRCFYFSSSKITKSIISGNSASLSGGGIDCKYFSPPHIVNSIFTLNSASHFGGAMACFDNSSPAVRNCTVTKNSASSHGGGIYGSDSSSPRIINSILWQDTPDEIYASTASVTYSDIQNGYGGEGNICLDPEFIDPDGGDYHLGSRSPCIDKGTGDGAPFIDTDDLPRPGGAGYDLGAYESQAAVIHSVFSGDSIQEAIDVANNGEVIIVGEGIYRENIRIVNKNITLRSTDPEDPKRVAQTIIDGNQTGSVVTFSGSNSVLSGFTLQNGHSLYGGAIYCSDSSSPGIHNCTLTGNSASQAGGGIACQNFSSPGITNCIITGNSSALSGGGIACSDHCSPSIINCTITQNSASGKGGGIYIEDLLYSPRIINCILWNDIPDEISSWAPVIISYSDVQNLLFLTLRGEGNMSVDPGFIDPGAGDYHLSFLPPFSPCIDKGTNDTAPFSDKDGQIRPSGHGYDIGSYELSVKDRYVYYSYQRHRCQECHIDIIENDQPGHAAHIGTNPGGAAIDCTACHADDPGSSEHYRQELVLFADGKTFDETAICDSCHSPDGAFDGVNDPVIGAKANWENGVYQKPSRQQLTPGLENWCAGCHDNGTSVYSGVSAPAVMGDNSTYGYNITGHKIACSACHDVTTRHIDGQARTYSSYSDPWKSWDIHNYQNGYRLKYRMIIPLDVGPQGGEAKDQFALCFECHDENTRLNKVPPYLTNFQDNGINRHSSHVSSGLKAWDSDWNYLQPKDEGSIIGGHLPGEDPIIDSRLSCPACHNVHGSPNPVMIRHGELISSPGTQDKVAALNFRWYKEDGYTPTIFGDESLFADVPVMGGPGGGDLENSRVCNGCHGGPMPVKYNRTWQSVDKPKGSWDRPALPPSLRFLKPAPGSKDIAVDTSLSFLLLSNQEDDPDWSTFSISLKDSLLYSQTYTYDDSEVMVIPVQGRPHCYEVTVNPSVDFGDQQKIRVDISLQDTAGHRLTSPEWYFDTGVSSPVIWRTPARVHSENIFWSPELLIDDHPETGNAYSPFSSHWLIFDLGQSYQVGQVRFLLSFLDSRLWNIYVSDDPNDLGPAVKMKWLAEPDPGLAPDTYLPAWATTSFDPKQGRYVMIETGRGPLEKDTLMEMDFAP